MKNTKKSATHADAANANCSLQPSEPNPIVNLECCHCGTSTRGRQWWNRDTGYGICNDCIPRVSKNKNNDNDVASVPMGEIDRNNYYGVRGFHWDVKEDAPATPTTAFDYENQAWVVDGKYVRCGHPDSMQCSCYGKLHEGEAAAPKGWSRIEGGKEVGQ